MDNDAAGESLTKSTRRRDLPPNPQHTQRGHRGLPPLPRPTSQDTVEEAPAPKSKKKKSRKEVDGDEAEDRGVEMGSVGSRRASENREPLTPEPDNGPPQRRKKKKKTPTIDLEDDQANLVNGVDQNTDGEEVTKKMKKKKKPRLESQLTNELDVEEDDIITDAQPPIPQHSLFSAPLGQSQPVGKVFVEKSKRFHAADRSDGRKPTDQADNFMDIQPFHPLWTTRDVSVKVHGTFRVMGLFCHGFLAGYAVCNIIVVYVLAGQQLTALSNLLQQYHSLAYPSQSLLYLLLTISTVSAFDRVNLAKGSMAISELVTLDPVALASFLYFSALVLTLSQQMTSDRINLYPTANETLWPVGSEHQILYPWVTVNLVIAVLVGVAWISISTRPEVDYTEGFLMAMEIDSHQPEEKPDITA